MPGLKTTVIMPPMTQLNTPYASLPTVSAIMRAAGHEVTSWDASLDLALSLYSADGVRELMAAARQQGVPDAYEEMLANRERYTRIIDPLIAFLQGRDSGIAGRIVRQSWLPQGPRFVDADPEIENVAFGDHGTADHARWLATLVLQDLADCWRCSVSPGFGLTSYDAQVAMTASSFDGLAKKLDSSPDPIERRLLHLCEQRIGTDVELVILSVPFPGNLPAALRIAQWCRENRPHAHITMGGGYPSTELRRLNEPRLFTYVDSVLLDEGEDALPSLANYLQDKNRDTKQLQRCFLCTMDGVAYHEGTRQQSPLPTPDYSDIPTETYLDLIDTWNPVQRLCNEGRWLKLIAARGCYWKRCSFCDTSLPYIADYQPQRAAELADRMDELHAQTGLSSFHFTDEAAPPALLLGLALELLQRGRAYTWWGNIRFDTYFTPDRCRVLAAGGMLAVTGGLETANDRLLPIIAKGVSVAQAAQVGKAFADAGILVHAYLMYGFPGETEQDSIDSMEVVRQLMNAGCIHSGFWHRFTTTAHSPIGLDPDKFGIKITGPAFEGFAWNNLEHVEPGNKTDHDAIGVGLATAMQHWLLGEGLDEPVQSWFDYSVPLPEIGPDHIQAALEHADQENGERFVWLGEPPSRAQDDMLLVDECGELQRYSLNEGIFDLLASARPQTLRQLPQASDADEDLCQELGPLGLCRI